MDQSKGILAFFQVKHPDKGYDVGGALNELMSYNLRPNSVADEIAATVAAILQISGKSIRTLYNGMSLLKLPDAIQIALSNTTFPVSQGYLFAANSDCPDRDKIFEEVIKNL